MQTCQLFPNLLVRLTKSATDVVGCMSLSGPSELFHSCCTEDCTAETIEWTIISLASCPCQFSPSHVI
uniref:Uncharacterized protein n=1 Tax=Arundo donax TaxID=35708 RepID=A0A0A9BW56_ARUDO